MSNGSTTPAQFDTLTSMTEAEASLLRAVGEVQLKASKALAIAVAAEGDEVVIAQKRAVLQQLKNTYRRLSRNQRQADRLLFELKYHVNHARWLVLGEAMMPKAVPQFWKSYKWLLKNGITQADTAAKLLAMKVTDADRTADNFAKPAKQARPAVDMHSGEEPHYSSPEAAQRAQEATERMHRQSAENVAQKEIKAAPPEIATVIGLAAWCSLSGYIPRAASSAMTLFVNAVGILADAAAERESQIRAWLAEVEKGVYLTFDPLKIDAVPHNTAAQAAQGAA